MKRIKLIPSLILLALCIAILGIGIYAAAPAGNTITGTVTVNAANAEVGIALYDDPTGYNPGVGGYQFGDGTTKKGNTRTGLSLSYSAVEFDASSANVLSDVATVTKLIVVKNNSTTKHLGVYFWNRLDTDTIHSSDPGWVNGSVPSQAKMTYDNSYNVTGSDIIYGNQTTHYNPTNPAVDSPLNGKVKLDCTFYSHIAPGGVVEMFVRFSLASMVETDISATALNLYLNVEEYQPNNSDTTGFVKWAPPPTGSASRVVGPESGSGIDIVYPNGPGAPLTDPYTSFRAGLVAIVVPQGVTSLGKVAEKCTGFMYNCGKLVAASIPNTVTAFGGAGTEGSIFEDCVNLVSMTIPTSVSAIEDGIFNGCTNLGCIIVDPNNTTYDSRNNCNAIINTSTNKIEGGCKNTIIPNTVVEIGYRAFYGCTGLTSITIPSSVTTIGSKAFCGCTGLTSITIPSGVTEIGGSAFADSGLETAVFEVCSGWVYTKYGGINISENDLANPATAAYTLLNTYSDSECSWQRSV